MSLLQAGFGSSGEYTIDDSLRFRSSASAYLSRTPASDNKNLDFWSFGLNVGHLGSGTDNISNPRSRKWTNIFNPGSEDTFRF
jgi:hypothetical protein